MPKVSIIIPVYNAENTIVRCLNSIVSQTFKDWEIVLINDGSTDNSMNICKKYVESDKRIHLFNIPNGGVSHARNKGMEHACGEYVTFVDSDDYLLSSNYLSECTRLCSDLMVTNYLKPESISNDIYKEENRIEILFEQRAIRTVWAKFFLTRIIREHKVKFEEDIRFAEDTLFVLDYVRYVSSVTYVFKRLYNYVRPIFSSVAKYRTSLEEYIHIMDYLQSCTSDFEKKSYNVDKLKRDNTECICWPYISTLYLSGRFSFGERHKYYDLFCKHMITPTKWAMTRVLCPLFPLIRKTKCFLLIDICFKFNFSIIGLNNQIRKVLTHYLVVK